MHESYQKMVTQQSGYQYVSWFSVYVHSKLGNEKILFCMLMCGKQAEKHGNL